MPTFKKTVEYWGVRPPVWYIIGVLEVLKHKYNIPIVITSIRDGRHSANSLHYRGMAVDFRKNNMSAEQLVQILGELKDTLGQAFDVINEATHIHIEYDPEVPQYRLIEWVD